MPDPVRSCRDSIDACSAADREAEAVGRKLGVITRDVTPAGAGARETKERQKVGVREGLTLVGAKVAEHELLSHAAGKLAGRALGVAAAAAGPLLLAKDLGEAILRAKEEGDQLRTAYQRDVLVLASAYAAAEALPPGYVAHVETDRAAVRGSATKIVTDLMRSDARWAQQRRAATTDARAGVVAAQAAGVASHGDLKALLARDPEVARRYDESSAFRHGVDAVVWSRSQGAKAAG